MHIDNENFDITCPNALLSQCLSDSYCNLTITVPAAPLLRFSRKNMSASFLPKDRVTHSRIYIMKTLISLVLTRSRLSAYRTPTVIGQLACLSAFRTPNVIGLSSAADGRRLRDGRGRHRLSRVRPCCWAMCRCGPRPRAGPDSEARGLSSPRPCKHGRTCDGGGQMRFRRACRPSPGPRQDW